MANAQYRLKGDQGTGSDLLTFDDSGTPIRIRVRPGEVVEVDLADGAQDAAFDESKYTALGATSYSHKLKPSA